jgi:hypothetical protein
LFRRILLLFREKIRTRSYIMTLHAEEKMANDALTIFDVESCVLAGEIVERQRDKRTSEWKYIIQGLDLHGNALKVTVKLGVTGKLVFITVFSV